MLCVKNDTPQSKEIESNDEGDQQQDEMIKSLPAATFPALMRHFSSHKRNKNFFIHQQIVFS
jgi:hypothetical protein